MPQSAITDPKLEAQNPSASRIRDIRESSRVSVRSVRAQIIVNGRRRHTSAVQPITVGALQPTPAVHRSYVGVARSLCASIGSGDSGRPPSGQLAIESQWIYTIGRWTVIGQLVRTKFREKSTVDLGIAHQGLAPANSGR